MGWFTPSEQERRASFIRAFIYQHYSTYRPEDANMEKVCKDAETAWEVINRKGDK